MAWAKWLAALAMLTFLTPASAGVLAPDVVDRDPEVQVVPLADTPLLVDELGDTMAGNLGFGPGLGVSFPAGLLTGDGALRFGGAQVCVAGLAVPGCAGSGDISGVLAGAGLLGGALSGDATLSVDTGFVQRRLASSCGAGFAIRAVDAAGTVTCQAVGTGTVTSVASGAGLAGGPITGSGTLSIATGGVTSAMLLDGGVALADLGFDPATQAELDVHKTGADHDARYYTEAELNSLGTLNSAANPVDWTKLKGVPGGFADGVDADSGGDITDIVTLSTSGLTGGAASGAVSLAVNPAVVQMRLLASCSPGFAIRVVNQDGNIACEQDDVGVTSAWLPSGNAGTTPGTNFLGTTDNAALEVKVNGARALRVEPGSTPNLVGGHGTNLAASGVVGAAIAGGGAAGTPNRVTDNHGTVAGGHLNLAGDNAGTTADAILATVGGGYGNTASGFASTVAGGRLNTAVGQDAFVGGGVGNRAGQVGHLSSTIAGGSQNRAEFDGATVGGGFGNVANGFYATIGGGYVNNASAYRATIAGGNGNVASDWYAAVGGGVYNNATSDYATVPGGLYNNASGDGAFAAGTRAKALHNGAFVWGDNLATNFESTAVNQFLVRATNGVGINTNTPVKTLHVNGDVEVGRPALWTSPGDDRILNFGDTDFVWIGEKNADDRMVMRATTYEMTVGNVGLSRTPTANKLEVQGDASKSTAGSWLANSDARIKTDVRDLDGALATLAKVRPVVFHYTPDYLARNPDIRDIPYYNVIAQEFQQVFPDYVKDSGEGWLQVDTYPMLITAVAAVQELEQEVRAKDHQLAVQSDLLAHVLERLDRLEQEAGLDALPAPEAREAPPAQKAARAPQAPPAQVPWVSWSTAGTLEDGAARVNLPEAFAAQLDEGYPLRVEAQAAGLTLAASDAGAGTVLVKGPPGSGAAFTLTVHGVASP